MLESAIKLNIIIIAIILCGLIVLYYFLNTAVKLYWLHCGIKI